MMNKEGNMDSKQLEKRKKVLLDLMNDKIYVPMKIKELAIILQVSKEERPDLELVLNELLAEGKIEISKRGKYKIAKEKTVTGTFVTHRSSPIRSRKWLASMNRANILAL